jgi:epoxyqueuosine reductase
MQKLTERLKKQALALGFNLVGVVAAAPGKRLGAYLAWLERQYQGEMGYLARPDRVARRQDPSLMVPGLATIVCVGLDYHTLRLPPEIAADPARGRISNYAWQLDYHDLMTPRLEELGRWLAAEARSPVQSRAYVDTGAILERDHAESAGLGFTGKNSMLIAPRRGSWFFLGELLTTIPLVADEPPDNLPDCGRCTRCLTACPTHAFPSPYVLDARRCISYLTIELKGWIPRDLRPQMGHWIYGCDVCQDVCPFNRFAPETGEAGFRAVDVNAAAPPLLDLLALDEAGFQARFAHSPIRRIKRGRFLRNVCVAAGNWGDVAAVPALTTLLTDSEPLVRGHSAWALGQMGGDEARQVLGRAMWQEEDEQVRGEIAAAMSEQQNTP